MEEVVAELELTAVPARAAGTAAAPPVPAVAAGAEQDSESRIDEGQKRHLLGARRALAAAREAAALRELELTRERELLNRRLAELRVREEALAQRERQIAEQRHIMSEEYRLLRQQQAEPRRTAGLPARGRRARHGSQALRGRRTARAGRARPASAVSGCASSGSLAGRLRCLIHQPRGRA